MLASRGKHASRQLFLCALACVQQLAPMTLINIGYAADTAVSILSCTSRQLHLGGRLAVYFYTLSV